MITISIESFKVHRIGERRRSVALVSYVTNALQKTGHLPDARLPMGFFLAGLVCCAATGASFSHVGRGVDRGARLF